MRQSPTEEDVFQCLSGPQAAGMKVGLSASVLKKRRKSCDDHVTATTERFSLLPKYSMVALIGGLRQILAIAVCPEEVELSGGRWGYLCTLDLFLAWPRVTPNFLNAYSGHHKPTVCVQLYAFVLTRFLFQVTREKALERQKMPTRVT
jgi:hypothetical protein